MKIIAAVLLFLIIVPALLALSALVVMLGGNMFLEHYGITTLSFKAAFGLVLACGTLFAGSAATRSK